MSGTLLLGRNAAGCRAAHLRDGVLLDYWIDSSAAPSRVGGVYRARVVKSLRGLDAAIAAIPGAEVWLDLGRGLPRSGERRVRPPAEGDLLTVQVVQDAQDRKLARATAEPVLAGRHVAFMPLVARPALSHRIADNDQRARLGALLRRFQSGGAGGFLALQRAAAVSDAVLEAEAGRLRRRWQAAELPGDMPGVLVPAETAIEAMLRLLLGPAIARIEVDSIVLVEEVRGWVEAAAAEWHGRISRRPAARCPFDEPELREQAEAALEPAVALPSGGALAIEPAAGLWAIDVDTDRMAGASAAATFAAVNREAAVAIARQIRLRNLGGRIVIDFAGLGAARALEGPVKALRQQVREDPMAVRIGAPTTLGLVEAVRRRERPPLAQMLRTG